LGQTSGARQTGGRRAAKRAVRSKRVAPRGAHARPGGSHMRRSPHECPCSSRTTRAEQSCGVATSRRGSARGKSRRREDTRVQRERAECRGVEARRAAMSPRIGSTRFVGSGRALPLLFDSACVFGCRFFFRAQPHVGLALVSCSCVWAAHGGSCDARSRIDCQSRAWSPNGPRSRDARSPDARGTRVRGPCVASLGRVWTPLVRARCSVNSTQWTRQNVDAKR